MKNLYPAVFARYNGAPILGGRFRAHSITSHHQGGFIIELTPWASTEPTLTLNVVCHLLPVRYGLTLISKNAWWGLRADCSEQTILAFLETGDPSMIYPDHCPNADELRQRLSIALASTSIAAINPKPIDDWPAHPNEGDF